MCFFFPNLQKLFVALLQLILETYFLEQERTYFKLKQLPPCIIISLFSNSKQTLNMTFTKLHTTLLLLFFKIFVV